MTPRPTEMAVAATNKIKNSLASMLPKKNHLLSPIPAESLCQLVKENGKTSFLKQRCHSTLPMRSSAWKRRFVILVNSALYIYDDNTSQCPKSCISLVGYNAVRRVESGGKSCPWAFALVSEEDRSCPEEAFACSSDQERREWMSKVKENLCKANNVPSRKMSLVEQFASGLDLNNTTMDEVSYEMIEEPVYRTETPATVSDRRSCFRSSGLAVFTDDEEEDGEDDYNGFPNVDSLLNGHDGDEDDSYQVGIWCRLKRKGAVKRRKNAVSSVTSDEE